jgi:hypothetical protein
MQNEDTVKQRNPENHRQTPAQQRRTEAVIERYRGKVALLQTWENQPDDIQADNHDYIIQQRATVRTIRNLILHRGGSDAEI